MLPLARTEKLIVHPMEGETLIYDMERRMALCLNLAATLIWRRCDGQTSVAELTQALRKDLLPDADEDAVWAGLEALNKIHLLTECPPLPEGMTASLRRRSRRKLVVTMASAISTAFVASVLAPTAAQAASCVVNHGGCHTSGQACLVDNDCCSCKCKGNNTCN